MTEDQTRADEPACNPSSVIYSDPQPNRGERLADGRIICHGCGSTIPDNSGPGLKPSCPNCWAAVDISDSDAPAPSPDAGSDWWRRFVGNQ